MKLEIAGPKDNSELLEFHTEFPVKGLVEFKVDRREDYFGPYKIQSDLFRTYVLRDEKQKIQAAASFIFHNTFQDGKLQRICYATDLRVAPNRRAILEWSQHFLPVMKAVAEDFQVSHFFSVINLTEPSGLNLFIRPRTMKRPLPRYYLYRKFNLVSLHGQFPWAPRPLPHVRIRPGSPQNIDALLAYILKRSYFRSFASVWDLESLQNKIKRLPHFELSQFLVAFDSEDNVIGCLAPWRPSGTQDWIPRSYSLRAHNFRQFLKFGRIFGWTRTLSKPIRSTGYETPLKFRYLTNLHVDNEDIFESLLSVAYENARADEFLLYAQVEQDFRTLPPQHWISAKIPQALYAVVPPGEESPSYLHPSISQNPEIEACFLV
jgi:hypothetical protein